VVPGKRISKPELATDHAHQLDLCACQVGGCWDYGQVRKLGRLRGCFHCRPTQDEIIGRRFAAIASKAEAGAAIGLGIEIDQ
jgi:hypothetical protein